MDKRPISDRTSSGNSSNVMERRPDYSTQPHERNRQPVRKAPVTEPRIERIARRAHELYEARGGTDGRALEDWLQAEREIDAES
jgi:hypothetical protein